MTDREKMQTVLNCYGDKEPDFTQIVLKYLNMFPLELYDHNNFYKKIHTDYMLRISELQKSIGIARENAQYVELYLKGDLYKNEEYAKQCLPLQIEHIEKVTKLLKEK